MGPGQLYKIVIVQHMFDGISQEEDEQYNITLTNFANLNNYTFVNFYGTIIDSNSKLKS